MLADQSNIEMSLTKAFNAFLKAGHKMPIKIRVGQEIHNFFANSFKPTKLEGHVTVMEVPSAKMYKDDSLQPLEFEMEDL